MNTYTAHIIYRIVCEGVSSEQYEEQWRIVLAHDDRDALERCRELAKEDEAVFIDRHGRAITWQLVGIKDISPTPIEHGSLLFSSVKEIDPLTEPVWISEADVNA
jgi:hypothetical protein